MRVNVAPHQSNVNSNASDGLVRLDRKGRATDMTIDSAMAALAAIIFIGPLLALAVAAVRFGADSRPGVGDPDRRPWLVSH
jgi:hypothetical protein